MFIGAGLLYLISFYLWFTERQKLSLIFLFSASLLLGFTVSILEPYLLLWDEQYHALVAKNLSKHPLLPTLYDNPILPYDYRIWVNNYVWLHKQPLFLWQMALSIKLFGVNEVAVRLPSVIMHAFFPLVVYRIGALSLNKNVAFLSAILASTSYFFLELISGTFHTDHNDIAFVFYVTVSFWSWFEYEASKKEKWIYLIAVSAGFAVLTKWLMGSIVFIPWGLTLLFQRGNKTEWINALKAFSVFLLTFIPWQIYILMSFPQESRFEYKLASDHFIKIVEGHGGDFFYHFRQINLLYGSGLIINIALPFSIIYLFLSLKNKHHKIFFISTILFVYLFYSIAQTKMPAFTFILSSLVFISLGNFLWFLIDFLIGKIKWLRLKIISGIAIFAVITFLYLDLSKIADYHTWWRPQENNNRFYEHLERLVIDKIDKEFKGNNWVIFNTRITPFGEIPFMFYTNKIAYNQIPSPAEIETAQKKGYDIIVLDLDGLPQYIQSNPKIIKLKIKVDPNRHK